MGEKKKKKKRKVARLEVESRLLKLAWWVVENSAARKQ
jgi:hypothetical protein